jgi:NAD(P)-dependent dehydrogenase (short-subunit alcohol dehydrogenase family)
MLFQDKVALITGAGSGIGRAVALAFAQGGASVVVADRNEAGAAETVALVTEAGGKAVAVIADVSQEADVEAMVAAAVAHYGRLDCAVNNAAISGWQSPLHTLSTEQFDAVIATNLRSVFLCLKYEIAQMLKNGGGSIVNMASIAGLVAAANLPHYAASKHGVIGLTKVAAVDYATQGIRVNAVAPGVIVTPMTTNYTAGDEAAVRQLFANIHPMQRVGEVNEVAQAIVWLCSPHASFVTGTVLPVDGGLTAQ